jgi:hypothetical protein
VYTSTGVPKRQRSGGSDQRELGPSFCDKSHSLLLLEYGKQVYHHFFAVQLHPPRQLGAYLQTSSSSQIMYVNPGVRVGLAVRVGQCGRYLVLGKMGAGD